MKTLADILRESREEIERHGKVIDKLIEESKEAGVVWPEIEPIRAIIIGNKGPIKHHYQLGSIVDIAVDCGFYYRTHIGAYTQSVSKEDLHFINDVEQ